MGTWEVWQRGAELAVDATWEEFMAQDSPWTPPDQKPEAGELVLVVVQTPKPCVLMAMWCPKLTLPIHPDTEGGDYDAARDEYFASEGWYQCYAVSGSLDDFYWLIHEAVTGWMELPKP